MAAAMDALLRDVDVESMPPRHAAAVLRAATELERRISSLKLLVAARAAESVEWAGEGHRSPESWLAALAGTHYGEAAGTLAASKAIEAAPAVAEAVRAAELSGAQVRELATALTGDNATRLLSVARQGNVETLRKECRRERAAARSDAEERALHDRIHRQRFWRDWIDNEGAFRFEGRCTAEDGAHIRARLEVETNAVFRHARKQGRREPYAAYRFDAFRNALTTSSGARGPTRTRTRAANTHVVIRVDAARLEGRGGLCEAVGTGPVPVDTAIGAILAGAFTKVVLHDGVDVRRVTHHGRHVPAEVRTAVLEANAYTCANPACDATQRLQLHHYTRDFAAGEVTAYWTLAPLCPHDHDLVTYDHYVLRGTPGAFEFAPP